MTTGLLDQLVTLLPSRGLKAVSGPGFRSSSYYPQLSSLTRDPLRLSRQAQDVYIANRHVRKAERVISQRFSTVDWHLEDGDGTRIGTEEDENADPRYLAVLDLLERPYRVEPGEPYAATPRSRSDLWGLGCRHMGCTGMAYWFLDEIEELAGTPTRIIYINPCRMKDATDATGNLVGWVLDPDARGGGMPLDNREVIPFYLEPPDRGHIGTGLVETAMSMVDLTRFGDRHAAGVMAGSGRLSGVFSPKGEATIPQEEYDQLVMDLRNASDNPDASKRMHVLKGPVEFTRLSATPSELDLVAVMNLSRDEVAELWGVPRSQVGGQAPAGMNSGESKGYDEAVLWQNAVGPRLRSFAETVQFELLDRYQKLDMTITLVIEEPQFDDETPMFERAKIAAEAGLPLTNRQRLELIGADPFGDARDDEVWLPSTFVQVYPVKEPAPTPPALLPFTGQTPMEPDPMAMEPMKAKVNLDPTREKGVAAIRADVLAVLRREGARVAARVREKAEHLSRKPTDIGAVFDAARLERDLTEALRPHVEAIAEATGARVTATLGRAAPAKADARAVVLERLLKAAGLRIRGISATTRESVALLIKRGVDQGMGAAELGDLIGGAGDVFGEERAERIARTETATVLNEAAVAQYREFGVDRVQVVDGDEDDACATADGQTWTLDRAEAEPIAHPNCVRSFTPLIGAPA